jgi:hypothetical protein
MVWIAPYGVWNNAVIIKVSPISNPLSYGIPAYDKQAFHMEKWKEWPRRHFHT